MNEQEFNKVYNEYLKKSKSYNGYSRFLYEYKRFNDKVGKICYRIARRLPFYKQFRSMTYKFFEKTRILRESFLDEVSMNYGDSFSLYLYENLDTINLNLYRMRRIIDLKMNDKKDAYILMKRFNECIDRLDSLQYLVDDSSRLERLVMEIKKDSRNYETKSFNLGFNEFFIGLIAAYLLFKGIKRIFKK
ncbi:hypothetical protein J7K74_00300 [Candidatus Woesearchaeota archaeon]|nr:hypothetical protein [Candidatus Woesearchaeota archaeon]